MMARIAHKAAANSMDDSAESVSVDDDGIDDPFASDSDSPPKRPAAAAAATKAKSAALSESGDSDGYSDDEFAAENKATAAAIAPASASKLASMFASKASVSSSSSKPAAAPVERGRTRSRSRSRSHSRSRSASRSRNHSRSASRSPSPFSSREPRSRGRQRSRSRTPPRDRSRSGPPRSRSRSPRASAPSGRKYRIKEILFKKRDDDDGGGGGRKVPQGKSSMDEQNEKLAATPHYVRKQKQLTLTKLGLAGFMSAAKKTDYSKQVSGLLADIKNCTFKPQLNHESDEKDTRDAKTRLREFKEKVDADLRRRNEELAAKQRKLDPQFTFSPQLSTPPKGSRPSEEEEGKSKDPKVRFEAFKKRIAADLHRRNEELAAKQRKLDPQCTFSPQLSSPSRDTRRSEKLRQPFLQRYHKDLDKRDAGIEAKIAAAKLGTHTFAPQITATAMAVGKARGGFLERTIRDVELRNKKMRYRAKLLDLEPPVHGRISVPEPEQDPFLKAQQRREMSRSASARHSLAHTRSHSAQGSDDDEDGGGREDGRREAHGRARNPRDRLDESDGAGKWATSTGHMRGLNGSASLSRVRPATATSTLTTSAVAPAILGGTIPRAPARPSIGSSVEPPRRGRRMSASEKKRYELELRARKRAEAAARAAGRNGADGRSHSRGANSSDAGSRRASIDRSGGSSHRSQRKPAAGSPPRSRSSSRTPSPRRSRTPSPVSRRHTRRHSRGRSPSHSRSPSSATGGRSRSSSPFADPHSIKKRQRYAQPQGASHARRRSRSRSPSPFASSRSPSPLHSRSSSRSPSPAKGRRRS